VAASMMVQMSWSRPPVGSSRRMARVVRIASKSSMGSGVARRNGLAGPTDRDGTQWRRWSAPPFSTDERTVAKKAVIHKHQGREPGGRPQAGSAARRRGRSRGVDLDRVAGAHGVGPRSPGAKKPSWRGKAALLPAQQDRPGAAGQDHSQHRMTVPWLRNPFYAELVEAVESSCSVEFDLVWPTPVGLQDEAPGPGSLVSGGSTG